MEKRSHRKAVQGVFDPGLSMRRVGISDVMAAGERGKSVMDRWLGRGRLYVPPHRKFVCHLFPAVDLSTRLLQPPIVQGRHKRLASRLCTHPGQNCILSIQ